MSITPITDAYNQATERQSIRLGILKAATDAHALSGTEASPADVLTTAKKWTKFVEAAR